MVCGNRQLPGIDYDESTALVVRDESIKMVYANSAADGLETRQFDVVTAYMNAAIKGRRVYMRLPTGFPEGNLRILHSSVDPATSIRRIVLRYYLGTSNFAITMNHWILLSLVPSLSCHLMA